MTSSKLIAALVGGVSVLLAGLFYSAQAVDSDEHDRYSTALHQLKESDAILNQNILLTRDRLIGSDDPINTDLAALRLAQDAVARVPSYLKKTATTEIASRVEVLTGSLRYKEGVTQQFNSQNAILNNSLRYFPAASDLARAAALEAHDARLESALTQLTQDILRYSLESDEEIVRRISTRIDDLVLASTDRANGGVELTIALNHARTILARKPVVDRLTQQLMAIPIASQSESVDRLYNGHHAAAQNVASYSRLGVYLVTMTLLSVVCTTLRGTTSERRRAKASLESEIVDRNQSADSLKKNEVLLRTIVDSTPDWIFIHGTSTVATSWPIRATQPPRAWQ